MKICIVADGHWDQLQGGAEYQLLVLARELAARGHEVHYLFADRGTPLEPGPILLYPMHLPKLVRRLFHPYHALLWPQVFRTLDSIGPDVVINRVGNGLTGICARYGERSGVLTVWHVANITDLLPWKPPRDRTLVMAWIDRKLLEYGIRHVDLILAQAVYQDAFLQERFGRQADLVVANFHPEPAESPAEATTLDVVWVANIKPKKQPEAFIRLAGALSKTRNVRFIMIGRPADAGYQRQIDALLLEAANVDFRGELPIDEVNRILSQASVFVNTSVFEGFPNTFVQAWLNKVPVVSMQFDPDDVLVERQLGYHSRSFEQMVEDVALLLNDPDLRERIGARASEYARAIHSVSCNVDRIERLFEEARP